MKKLSLIIAILCVLTLIPLAQAAVITAAFPATASLEITVEQGEVVDVVVGAFNLNLPSDIKVVVMKDSDVGGFVVDTPYHLQNYWETSFDTQTVLGQPIKISTDDKAPGVYKVQAQIIVNGQIQDTLDLTLTILAKSNSPPVFNPINDVTVFSGETAVIPMSAIDADGDDLTFSFQPTPANSQITKTGINTAEFTWVTSQLGQFPFTFTVDDGNGGQDTETATVTVIEAPCEDLNGNGICDDEENNHAPTFTLDPVADSAVLFIFPVFEREVNQYFEIDVLGEDVDGDDLTLTFTPVTSVPSWFLFQDEGDDTALISGTPTAEDYFSILVKVEDEHGASFEWPVTFDIDMCEDIDNDGICDDEDPCIDQDNDGICDDEDQCPTEPEDFDGYQDEDGCPEDPSCDDADGDGICDDADNCPVDSNPGQEDTDDDGIGDACDDCLDVDKDGICDDVDNCPSDFNPGQEDADADGLGDACDDCTDVDGDGVCDDEEVLGCTDPTAQNFNPDATEEDNSCTYTACSDGIDNDSDGDIDFPADVGCQSADDDNEFDMKLEITKVVINAEQVIPGTAEYDSIAGEILSLDISVKNVFEVPEGVLENVNVNGFIQLEPGSMVTEVSGFGSETLAPGEEKVLSFEISIPETLTEMEYQIVINALGIDTIMGAAHVDNELVTLNLDQSCSDADSDGICDGVDNCPADFNPGQEDADADGLGDVCDDCTDVDGDGVCDDEEVLGCTDPTAQNFNPNATEEDNSCTYAQCSDGIDNDGDGLVDFGEDPGCDNEQDDDENQPPVITPLSDIEVEVNTPVGFDVEAVDPEGDGFTFNMDAPPGTDDVIFDTITGIFSWVPPTEGVFTFTFTATDEDGATSAPETVTITVNPIVVCPDADGDGVCDNVDNCPVDFNPGQEDADGDGIGDACDDCLDVDNDGICDDEEVLGCTDPTAQNFNPNATEEDNSCTYAQCSDGIDNDGDGLVDFGEDPGCDNEQDDDENQPPTLTFDPVAESFVLDTHVYERTENEYFEVDVIGEDPDGDSFILYFTQINGFTEFPEGVTWTDNGDGTATISGTPIQEETSVVLITVEDEHGATFEVNVVFNIGACQDLDNDGICDNEDPCIDQDNDGICDDDDQCPLEPEDFDGYQDEDGCPEDPSCDDADGDGICDGVDNCPTVANANQVDSDGDGIGDACDSCTDADDNGLCDDKEVKNLEISSVQVFPEVVQPGEQFVVNINVNNEGNIDLKDVEAEVIMYDFALKRTSGEFNLKHGRVANEQIVMDVPYFAQPGTYLVKVSLKTSQFHETAYRQVVIS